MIFSLSRELEAGFLGARFWHFLAGKTGWRTKQKPLA
jgi:hypothetical protein